MLRSKAAGLLFALVIVSMAVWGVEDIFSGTGGNLIKAGDRGISMQDFDEDVQDQLQALSRQQGRAVTKAEAVENGIVDQMFQQQASRLIVLGYGERIGARASTDAVMKEVFKEEAFNNALTGKFDAQVYEDALRRVSLTPRKYEQDVRDDLTRVYVSGAAGAAIEPPSLYAELLSKYEGEARRVSVLRVSAAAISDLPDPSEEELLAYFDENTAAFSEPERRGITILHFSPEDFRQSVEITEEDLQAAYETGKQRFYAPPQTRKYLEAYFATEAAALQALGILAAGGSTDALENVVSVTEQTSQKNDVLNTTYADQLFAVPQGAVTEPTAIGDQWVIARIDEIITGEPYPFEDVRDQVEERLISERAQSEFDEVSRNIDDLAGERLPLQEIGARIGAPAISYLPVDRQGNTQSGSLMLSLTSTYAEGLREVDDWFEGEVIDRRFDLDDGSAYLVQLDTIVPPRTPDFDEVRSRVLAAWKVSNRGEAVALYAEELAQQINRGDLTLEAAAANAGSSVALLPSPIRRSTPSGELSRSAQISVFAAKDAGTVVATPAAQQGEFLLVRIDEIEPPSEEFTSAMRGQLRNLLVQQLDADLGSALGVGISDAVEIVSNDGAFAAYKARNAAQ